MKLTKIERERLELILRFYESIEQDRLLDELYATIKKKLFSIIVE